MFENLNKRVRKKLTKFFDTSTFDVNSKNLLKQSFFIKTTKTSFTIIDINDFVTKFVDNTLIDQENFSQFKFNIDNIIENLSRIIQSTSTITFENLSQIFRININFQFIDDLIYHIHENNEYDIDESRLCISKSRQKDVFKITHDDNAHVDQHRAYRRLIKIVYIFKMSRKFRLYLRYYSTCQFNQIKRHNFYEKLTSIFTSILSFHIIVMNYIFALFEMNDMNVMFIMTNKTIH